MGFFGRSVEKRRGEDAPFNDNRVCTVLYICGGEGRVWVGEWVGSWKEGGMGNYYPVYLGREEGNKE